MDTGAESYHRFREQGDESGLAEIIRDYKDQCHLDSDLCDGEQKEKTVRSEAKASCGLFYAKKGYSNTGRSENLQKKLFKTAELCYSIEEADGRFP